MDRLVRKNNHRKQPLSGLGLIVLLIVPLIAAGCVSDDPLAMKYGVDACRLQKASDASPSELAAYETSDAEATHDEMADMTDDAMHPDATHDDAMHPDATHDDAMHDDEAVHDADGAVHGLGGGDVDWLVNVRVDEFNFGCAMPDIDAGSVLAIRFDNVGSMTHEAVVGPAEIQDLAEVEMAEMADMGMDMEEEMHHGFPSIALPPGESRVLLVELDDSGVSYIGCHVPGHWDAGMQMPFRVI